MPEVIFTGPAGRLEGRYHPAKQKNAPIAMVLHPHPQFRGNMNHPIVYQVYYAFVARGFSVLRFNFRGVGRSQGSFDHGTGYHDHNWGFWKGVSWQWGQMQQGDLSLIYGRVFPPAEAADPDRIPGFVGVLGPDGPLGYATNVRILETNDATGRPTGVTITGRSPLLDVQAAFRVESQVTTTMSQGPLANGINFLQLRGTYTVTGTARERRIALSGPGSAETFRAISPK